MKMWHAIVVSSKRFHVHALFSLYNYRNLSCDSYKLQDFQPWCPDIREQVWQVELRQL